MQDVHMNLYLDLDTVLELACIACALLALCAAGLALRGMRRLKARVAALETGLAAAQSGIHLALSTGQRAARAAEHGERELQGLAERLRSMELMREARSYDEAIDSARRGADPVALTEQFGLSRGEADLVSRLHGRRKSA